MDQNYYAALMSQISAPKSQQGKFVYRNGKYVDPNAKPQSKKGSGNQSWLSSLISELGGAGGATGGAAAGAAIGAGFGGVGALPGAIIGGLLGGFGGGTAGRLAENQIRDREWRLGDALKEGAVSGAFGAGGAAFQGLRGAQYLGKAGGGGVRAGIKGLGSLSDDAAKAVVLGGKKAGAAYGAGFADDLASAAKKTAGRNVLERTGNRQYRNVLGIDDIKSPLKSGPKTLFKADDMLAEAKRLQLSGTPKSMLRQVNTQYQRFNELVGRELAKSKGTTSLKELTKSIQDDVARKLPLRQLGDNVQDELVRSVDELSRLAKNGKLTAKDLYRFKNSLNVDSAFRKIQGDLASDLTAKETVDMALWRQADDWITKLAPGAKELTKRQSNLYGLSQGLSKMTLTPGDPKSVMEFATRIASPAVRNVQGALGRTTANIGAATPSIPGTALAGQIGRGAAVRGIGNNMFGTGGQPIEQPAVEGEVMPQGEDMFAQQMMGQDMISNQMMGGQGIQGGLAGAMQPDSPFSPQNAQMAVQQILAQGGDFDDVKKYLSIVEVMQELGGAGQGMGQELNVTKPTSEKYAQAAGGIQALDQLESLIMNQGVPSGAQVPGRGIGFLDIGARIKEATGTGRYDTLAFNAVDNLLRILTGAQAPESEIRRYMEQYIPRANDSPETVQTKLQSMRQQFNSILDLAQPGTATGANDFQSALQQYQPY